MNTYTVDTRYSAGAGAREVETNWTRAAQQMPTAYTRAAYAVETGYGGAAPTTTNYLLTEAGDILITEAGDRLTLE